jgi:trigger factor
VEPPVKEQLVTSEAKPELEVEVEAEELAGGQVQLRVTVPAGPVARIREDVLKTFSSRANIPGFRKGKVPRSLLERYLDQDALNEQVIETLVGDAYEVAIAKAGVEAINRPRVTDAKLTDEGTLAFSATVTRRPTIELGEYKGLKVTRHVTPVTDAQVEAELERIRSRRAQFRELPTDGAIEKGDLVVVDYEMLVDGEKREEASASGYPLEVGADQLFPEMNDALPGAKVGETREFQVSYPETHSDASLAGKAATFKVTAKEARRRQLAELDDEFAKQVSDLATLEELRARVRENLGEIGKAMAEDDVRSQLVRQVSEAAALDVPEALVGREVDSRIEDIEVELGRRGLTLNQHLRSAGQSFEDWRADIETDARAAARRALVLDEIGERENVKVTDEEIHEEMHARAEIERISEREVHERYEDAAMLNRLVTRIYQRKVVQFLLDNAEVTEEAIEPEAEGDRAVEGGG